MVPHTQMLGIERIVTPRMREISQMFGVVPCVDVAADVNVELPVVAGRIVLITGPSGCGKTTLLQRLDSSHACRLCFDACESESRAVIDCFDMPLCDTLALLARCGLSEAGILLKRPAELSQGQRYRFELAKCLASPFQIIIADEFCSVLDRTVACIVCWQMRKLISQMGKTLIAATAHEDIAQDLEPDDWLQMDLGGQATWQKGGGHVYGEKADHD